LHHRHGEVGAQHHLAPQGVAGDIGAGADVLAVEIEEDLGRLQDVGLDRQRAGRAEGGHQPLRLGAGPGLVGHQAIPRRRRTAGTRSARGTTVCAGWDFHSSWLASAAIFAPRKRSFSCTTPRAASSVPWITARGELRLSAYFSWLPKFFGLPR